MTHSIHFRLLSIIALNIIILHTLVLSADHEVKERKYCVVGGGAGGLQVAIELEKASLEWVLFERESSAGSFFKRLPRFGRLISINKRSIPTSAPTGRGEQAGDFSMRHDWNSLISIEKRFTDYSSEYYPSAKTLATYLNDIATDLLPQNKLHFNSSVVSVKRHEKLFRIELYRHYIELKEEWYCDNLIWATNLGSSYQREKNLVGNGWSESINYENAPEDLNFYRNQSVLIIGGGNAAYEVANAVAGVAARVTVWSRRAPRLAYQTHYPGDVRGRNTQLFDQYQLKTLDQLLLPLSSKSSISLMKVLPCKPPETDKDRVSGNQEEQNMDFDFIKSELEELAKEGSNEAKRALEEFERSMRIEGCPEDNTPKPRFEVSEETRDEDLDQIEAAISRVQLEHQDGKAHVHHIAEDFDLNSVATYNVRRYNSAYDIVIKALGWYFRPSLVFHEGTRPLLFKNKLPLLDRDGTYKSRNVPNLFFAGSLAHAYDWRRSSGGFIHGFRYTARAMVRSLIEECEEAEGFPVAFSLSLQDTEGKSKLLDLVLARAQQGDGIYQMFSELCLFVSMRKDEITGAMIATGFDEVPVRKVLSGTPIGRVLQSDSYFTLTFEYGRHFHGKLVYMIRAF